MNKQKAQTLLPIVLLVIAGFTVLAVVIASVGDGMATVRFVLHAISIIFTVAFVGTVAFGILVTATVPPLRPLKDVSVLGQRAMAFARFSIASVGLFATAYITWLVTTSYSQYSLASTGLREPTADLISTLAAVVLLAGFVYLFGLSVDLLRIGQRRRLNAIDLWFHRTQEQYYPIAGILRTVARVSMSSWIWILISFYLGPAFAGAFALIAKEAIGL